MTLTHPRLPDWQDRLSALIARAHREPFVWGQRDCCLWAADAMLAITGFDPAAGLRGRYSNATGAYRLLRTIGGLRGAGQWGGPQLPGPRFARDGDVGIVDGSDRPMLAVRSAEVWLCAATKGLRALPVDAARIAWGVGHA